MDTDSLWNAMKDLVIKTIISGEASISSLTKANITSRYNCYELFGIDVLLDEDLKPWLLEVLLLIVFLCHKSINKLTVRLMVSNRCYSWKSATSDLQVCCRPLRIEDRLSGI